MVSLYITDIDRCGIAPPGSSSLSVDAHADRPRLGHVHHHVEHGMYEFETHSELL